MEGRRKMCKSQWSVNFIWVKVTESMYLRSSYIEEKHYARFGGCRPYS